MTRALAALLLALALGACAAAPALAPQAPPPPRDEVRAGKPGTHVFWQDGHWTWRADQGLYFWSAGGWEPERPGQLWIPGYWRRVDGEDGAVQGWEWVEPRWEEIPR